MTRPEKKNQKKLLTDCGVFRPHRCQRILGRQTARAKGDFFVFGRTVDRQRGFSLPFVRSALLIFHLSLQSRGYHLDPMPIIL
jgi:hypothetical protein